MLARLVRRAVEVRAPAPCSRMSLTSVLLPEPETPVTTVKHAEREARRRGPCRLFCRAPSIDQRLAASFAARCSGTGTSQLAAQVLAGERRRGLRDLLRRPLRPPPRRRARRRRGRGRSPSRRRGSSPRRAPPPAPSCRGRASPGGWRAGGRCRAGGGRSTARRARRARPSACCRSGWPAGCAGSRRRRASPTSGRASGSRRRRRRGSAARSGISCTTFSAMARSRLSSAQLAPIQRRAGPPPAARESSSIAVPVQLHRQRLRPQPPALAGRAGVDRHVLLDLGADRRRVGLLVAPVEHGDDALELAASRSSSTSCPLRLKEISSSPLP